jgi:hypothetical protein
MQYGIRGDDGKISRHIQNAIASPMTLNIADNMRIAVIESGNKCDHQRTITKYAGVS